MNPRWLNISNRVLLTWWSFFFSLLVIALIVAFTSSLLLEDGIAGLVPVLTTCILMMSIASFIAFKVYKKSKAFLERLSKPKSIALFTVSILLFILSTPQPFMYTVF